jgi:broad-specificity NMP kinase
MGVDVFTGPPGCGKTTKRLSRIGQEVGCYLLAVPALHLIPSIPK